MSTKTLEERAAHYDAELRARGIDPSTSPLDKFKGAKQPASLGLLASVIDMNADALRALRSRIDKLEKAVSEKAPSVSWGGTYCEGKSFDEAQLITHRGSLWLCIKNGTSSVPGSDPFAWRLIVKKGEVQ